MTPISRLMARRLESGYAGKSAIWPMPLTRMTRIENQRLPPAPVVSIVAPVVTVPHDCRGADDRRGPPDRRSGAGPL